MRQVLVVTLLFSLFFGVSFWYGQTADICPAPIKYKVGEVDERFGINKDELKELLFATESAWEDPTKRELFVYDEDTEFTVNLIYDERQQLVHTEEEWRATLDKQEEDSQLIMDKVEKMSSEYKTIQDQYSKKRDAYETRLGKYNAQVEIFNKEGGAPPEDYERLQDEQKELSKALEELVVAEKGMNTLTEEINKLGDQGNKMVEVYNENVKKYNEIFGNSDIFTQGDFQRERINVYKFENKEELKRVMVHEFGHSLGIQHVEGEDSIMYYLMTERSGPVTLSEEDRSAFRVVCGDKEDFSNEVRSVIRNLLSIF
jgi:predicted  nucleic acid-binding Zn-ribbon protein